MGPMQLRIKPRCCAQPAPASCSTGWAAEGTWYVSPPGRGVISVGKGHTGAKPSKHSPLLPASLGRVKKTSRESLERADGAHPQHRQTRTNVGSSQESCPPSSMHQPGLPQPQGTRCSSQHKGRFPCLNPQVSTIPEEKASRNLSHCATLAELSETTLSPKPYAAGLPSHPSPANSACNNPPASHNQKSDGRCKAVWGLQ